MASKAKQGRFEITVDPIEFRNLIELLNSLEKESQE